MTETILPGISGGSKRDKGGDSGRLLQKKCATNRQRKLVKT